jgi:ABC-type sulfate/molybdate transport systems ATPase subunit
MEVAVEGLRFSRSGRTVLDIPSLGFPAGSTTAVFGPNGSGKTTLLRLIGGLERPAAGAIRIGGAAVSHSSDSRRHVGFAFQEAVFVGGTVRRNLDLALELRDVPPEERRARIAEAARECGIEAVLDRSARQLSSGEAQRANLARALALRAPLTLLDEPLTGIDRVARTQLLDDLPRMLATFAATTILVTHDREEAFRLADHLVVLAEGRVRAAGPKSAVYARPPDRMTAELLGYTVVEIAGRTLGVPAGAWALGNGELWVDLLVERVVDMGNHLHAVGAAAGERVDVRLRIGDPVLVPGDRVRITPRTCVPVG